MMAKCKICQAPFTKLSISHKACGPECALELARVTREAKERKKERSDKVRLRTRREWLKLAQVSFNAYIRERDKGKPCICCGMPLDTDAVGGGYDCGHYRSVGSAPHLRYDPMNAHGQRKQCNRYKSGNAADYRIGLIARVGLAAVEALEADQTAKKHTIPELQEIIIEYNRKLKELRRGNAR